MFAVCTAICDQCGVCNLRHQYHPMNGYRSCIPALVGLSRGPQSVEVCFSCSRACSTALDIVEDGCMLMFALTRNLGNSGDAASSRLQVMLMLDLSVCICVCAFWVSMWDAVICCDLTRLVHTCIEADGDNIFVYVYTLYVYIFLCM